MKLFPQVSKHRFFYGCVAVTIKTKEGIFANLVPDACQVTGMLLVDKNPLTLVMWSFGK